MKSSRHHSAFTLIELLVVIAIIALLASLLMSVLGRTKLAAQQTQSLANLKQWGTALNLALGESRQTLPSVDKTVDPANTSAWYNVLPPYLGEKTVAQMTTADYPQIGKKSVWVNPAIPKALAASNVGVLKFSYAMNTYLNSPTTPYQLNTTRVLHPGATVFMGEKFDTAPDLEPAAIKARFGQGDDFAADDTITEREARAAANFLFCDGHVDLKKRSEFDSSFFVSQPGRTSPLEGSSDDKIDGTFTFIPYSGAQPVSAH